MIDNISNIYDIVLYDMIILCTNCIYTYNMLDILIKCMYIA